MIAFQDPFVSRPLVPQDLDAVTAVVAASEHHDDGVVEIDAADIDAEWRRPAFDLGVHTLGVFEGTELVGFAEVFEGRAEVDVDPRHRGRGIGSALMRWTWERAIADGRLEIGQTIPDIRRDAVALLKSNGYAPKWTSWILSIALDALPDPVPMSEEYEIRDFSSGDEQEVYEVIERAFAEWPDREPTSLEAWRAMVPGNAAFSAPMSPVLVRDGRIVGAAIGFDYGKAEGWVQQLAVAREDRGRGLGRALLVESFRRAFISGRTRCGLSTDSRTGALPLYERAGMTVRRSYTRWSKTLPNATS